MSATLTNSWPETLSVMLRRHLCSARHVVSLALMYESLRPQTLHVIVVSGLWLLRLSEVIGFPSMTLVMVTCVM